MLYQPVGPLCARWRLSTAGPTAAAWACGTILLALAGSPARRGAFGGSRSGSESGSRPARPRAGESEPSAAQRAGP